MARPEPSSTPSAWFDYRLPRAAIAQTPLADRSASRMLVLERGGGVRDGRVLELPGLLAAGDCLVVNDTRVRQARLRGRVGERSGEALLLRRLPQGRWLALVRPARRLVPGACLQGSGWRILVLASWSGHSGGREVALEADPGADLERLGEAPLPPYIKVPLAEPERYQTVYARGEPVSAAAPTAGLHLTEALLGELVRQGVRLVRVQLEVGLATFAPLRSPTVEGHQMHKEHFSVSGAAAAAIATTRAQGGRVVAVGTTAVRCLEAQADGRGGVAAGSGETDLYLRPGVPFRVVDGLLTNFHQPRSSLLVLVSAFYGLESVQGAYRQALAWGYRFLSFGDCMFGWRGR